MQLLVLIKRHWFDDLPANQQAILNASGRYNRRYVIGDIVEVREDGYWLGADNSVVRGWNRRAFVVLEITGDAVDKAYEKIVESNGEVLFKRRYKIDIQSFPTTWKNKLINDGWARGTGAQIRPYIIDKAT